MTKAALKIEFKKLLQIKIREVLANNKGLKQLDIAKAIETSPENLSHFLSTKQSKSGSMLGLDVILKLILIYDIDPREIMPEVIRKKFSKL